MAYFKTRRARTADQALDVQGEVGGDLVIVVKTRSINPREVVYCDVEVNKE